MKNLLLALLICGAVLPASARDVRFGISVGSDWGYRSSYYHSYSGPGYYAPVPVYPVLPTYYPPVVSIQPPAPTVYVERNDVLAVPAAPAAPSGGMLYYCRQPQGYYPEVEKCPGGWLRAPNRPVDLQPGLR